MNKLLSALSILFLSNCVTFENIDVWDKAEKEKQVIGTPNTDLEFINESKLIKVSKKELEYNVEFLKKEKINSLYNLSFNVTKKVFIPCNEIQENESYLENLKKEEGLCGRSNSTFQTKFSLYVTLAASSILIVGLVPSWYSYYKAKQEEGKIRTERKEENRTEEKETKLAPIDGYLLLGSNLKSKKYPIKDGKLKIPTNDFVSYYFDSLPSLKESQSDSFKYEYKTYIVSNAMKDLELPFNTANQTEENESEKENTKVLDELEKQFNEKTCKKFDRKKLDELGDNFLSSINYSRGSTQEESKEQDKIMRSKEFYCSNFYNDLQQKAISKKLETLNRQSQVR